MMKTTKFSRCRVFVAYALAITLMIACAVRAHAGPRSTDAARLNNLGTALMNQLLPAAAAEKFVQAYAADPSLTVARLNEGIALLYLQKLPEARAALEFAVSKLPQDPRGWYALGLLERSENNPQQALVDFAKVLAIDPADADTHYLDGSIELELKDLPAATAEFRKTLALNPLHASAQFGLARCLQREGKADEARVALAAFQHITAAKLGYPLSHNYGEEGRYARVEDATLSSPAVGPMIPVTFKASWTSPASSQTYVSEYRRNTCVIDLQGATALIVPGPNPPGPSALTLYRKTTSKTGIWFEVLSDTGLPTKGEATACAVGDFDNDGLPDLALGIDGAVRLFRNLGNGTFHEVLADAPLKPQHFVNSLTFVDYDHDGDLDLLVTGDRNTLWRNNGNGTFTDWTREAGFVSATPTTSAVLSDLNNDRAVDLIITGTGAPTVYTNHREGPFTASPLYTAALPPATSVTTLDFDKDGFMDMLLTHSGAPGVTLWRNMGGHGFERVPLPLTDALSASGAVPIDFDNDGWIDIAALVPTAAGMSLRLFRNLGPAGFKDVSAQFHVDTRHLSPEATVLAAGLSHSGAQDLLVTERSGLVQLFSNVGGNANHSLRIALTGEADNKSGIGTKVEVYANGLWQKWESNGQPEILAGLGTATHADLVRLLWPTGVPQDEIIDTATPHPGDLTEIDRRGSSCPTLFAWNGHQYSFVSDVIGAAVIGHWISPTAHNIPDPDEWIKVPGSQLREHNGTYSLRFGEPMEEVNFVDQVRLIAVDHPAQTSVYPNEGFLSEPPFAQAKTVAAAKARPLAAAHDDKGNDVLSLLSNSTPASADPHYVRDFTNLPFAGFANTHSLTLDLGAWSAAAPLKLLLHGFIEYFSASSMYSAWQAGLTPVPPYIEAQAPDGSWHRVVDDMGFPAGLPRTVIVDLSGKLPPGTRNIRITTNLQIYWDQILVDNEIDAATPHQTELALSRASLAFRGYPQQLDGYTPGDLTYDYHRMSATGPFVPHRGSYTRYGDVTPLLRSVDDQFVIFGTGEDMDFEFSAAALPILPDGWTRDFFFYANGFVKDMDFYEASPFEVGKLPFHGMSTYPYPATEHYPDDPAHTAYQLEYNTRWEPGVTARSFQFSYQPTASEPDDLK